MKFLIYFWVYIRKRFLIHFQFWYSTTASSVEAGQCHQISTKAKPTNLRWPYDFHTHCILHITHRCPLILEHRDWRSAHFQYLCNELSDWFVCWSGVSSEWWCIVTCFWHSSLRAAFLALHQMCGWSAKLQRWHLELLLDFYGEIGTRQLITVIQSNHSTRVCHSGRNRTSLSECYARSIDLVDLVLRPHVGLLSDKYH